MTGFGAIPRRGAEVGGILLGKADAGEIWIDSLSVVPCEHRRGPSFLLSEQDRNAFDDSIAHQRTEAKYPVGLFRSNTRDQIGITDEDRELFDRYFPTGTGTFLLVRPYASKSSVGMFLVQKDGVLPASNSDVFPFQRWELAGESAPRRRPLSEARPTRTGGPVDEEAAPLIDPDAQTGAVPKSGVPAPESIPGTNAANEYLSSSSSFSSSQHAPRLDLLETPGGWRRAWHWIPLSFVFLLLGVLLGFQSALTFYPRPVALDQSTFALGLNATWNDGNLHIKWNRDAPAIRLAQHGRLEIQDGKYDRVVDLDVSSLQTGSVVYPPASAKVTLRLEVVVKGNSSALETLIWSRE